MSGRLRAEVLLDLSIWGLDRPLTYRIPEALAGRVVPGMKLLLVAFGAGFTWASTVVQW